MQRLVCITTAAALALMTSRDDVSEDRGEDSLARLADLSPDGVNGTGPSKMRRLHSLDALRGLDMLFIIGLDCVLRAASPLLLSEEGTQEVWRQLGHCSWEGLTLYDLIFPIFVFISGASMYCSIARAEERGVNRLMLTGKLWKRALILAFFGLLVNAWSMRDSLSWPLQLSSLRYASVLGLIGASCALAGSAVIGLRRKWCAPVLAMGILVIVWCLQTFGGNMTPEGCFNAKVDALLCPGALHSGSFDPEGPLCIISATALALLGYCAGWLSNAAISMRRQATALILMGGLCITTASQCGAIIKGIWTPAFVLAAGGVGYLLLAVFRPLCDAWGREKKLSMPLRMVGMNALFIYLLNHLPGYPQLCTEILAQAFRLFLHEPAALILTFTAQLTGSWLICFLLWKKRIFIKI